jgi:oxygen-independent coproporphyrinogen-3 oxidase
MQQSGQALLHESGFQQYEVSAYSLPHRECAHNLNYWEFGDYLGIGAGAHSKITDLQQGVITRFAQVKQPNDYLDATKRRSCHVTTLKESDLIFEFMLNALRLTCGVPAGLFTQRTGLPLQQIMPIINAAQKRGLLLLDDARICPSESGKKFLNNLVELFLP